MNDMSDEDIENNLDADRPWLEQGRVMEYVVGEPIKVGSM